ncbi:uncharacterized protein V6R79_019352 [Siganus canaliculatus]
MPRQGNMISALLLLNVVKLLCCDAAAAETPACSPTHEVACFESANYLNSSGPVSVEMCVGKKLVISLQHVSEDSVCRWLRGADLVQTANGSRIMELPPLWGTDSGKYTLSCETSRESKSLVAVSLHVVQKRPTKPMLILEGVQDPNLSPLFTCISEGCPSPTVEWSGNKKGKKDSDGVKAKSTISTSEYPASGVMCCATNAEGQECTQLYDYDLDTGVMKSDEVSNVTVSPGQSLLLRCRIKSYLRAYPVWMVGGKIFNETFACPSTIKDEICIRNDSHLQSKMAYLFVESVSLDHSGVYTCRSPQNKTKSVHVHVRAEGFLSVQLDKNKIIPALNASSSCLHASVSYHPVLQLCSWETPTKTRTKCIRDNWVTEHRTVRLCGPLTSGNYKLHLEAGGQRETKTMAVCVVGEPKFKFRVNEVNNTFTFETVSLVPANYTWMSCVSSNDSCETSSSWREIPDASYTDTDIFCNKTIKSSVSRDLVTEQHLRFCLTNSVGTWCQTQYPIYLPPSLQASRGSSDGDNSTLNILKVGSLVLFLALVVITSMLVYFIKKKKPQYQPQLQVIQMVGPNDNDYIYIDFKDFAYDSKWEFPRENLELGNELGSGAFGMVVQATAYGIDKPGVSQQVAVKMLKEKHQAMEKEALMTELKMLSHIGHHTNIVNLLGACTGSGPTYLIFQYCCHGDLLNYLKKNREHYHKSVTDAFNKDRFRSLYHNLQPRKNPSECERAVDDYVPRYQSTSRGQEDIALLTLHSDMDNFEDPEMYENLHDQTDDLQTLTFDDLLSFAFQVAKGMDFLSSKNCIHRDLAARNVLVTKGRMAKIGDFGLARDIENDSNYVVRGNVRLPVKWMAPESTFQGIYTMKSDVWAYGILLWEIFSLGVTPYPGMKVDHNFYSMIERGFKMDCPYYANESVYGIMCKCWALDPCKRPSFSKLVSFMCDELTDIEEKLYHNVLDQTSSDYQNAPAILDTSALVTEGESKTQSTNDYCRMHSIGDNKVEMVDVEAGAAEEKPEKT